MRRDDNFWNAVVHGRGRVLNMHHLDVLVGVAAFVHHAPRPGEGELVFTRPIHTGFGEADVHKTCVAVVHGREDRGRLQVLAFHGQFFCGNLFHKSRGCGVHHGDELAGLADVAAIVRRDKPALNHEVVGARPGQGVHLHFEVGVRGAVVFDGHFFKRRHVTAFHGHVGRNVDDGRLGVRDLDDLFVEDRVSARILGVPRAGDGVVAWAGCVAHGFVEFHGDEATVVRHGEDGNFWGRPTFHLHVARRQRFVPLWNDGVHHGEGGSGGDGVTTCVGGGEPHGDGGVASTCHHVSSKVVGPNHVPAVFADRCPTTRLEPRSEFVRVALPVALHLKVGGAAQEHRRGVVFNLDHLQVACFIATIVGSHPETLQGVFVVTRAWDQGLGELHDHVLTIVRGGQRDRFWNRVALCGDVGFGQRFHKHRCRAVGEHDFLDAGCGVAALVRGCECPDQRVRLGTCACHGVNLKGDVGRATASVDGCSRGQHRAFAAIEGHIFREGTPGWRCGVHDRDGLNLGGGVAAIVGGGERPHDAVGARA